MFMGHRLSRARAVWTPSPVRRVVRHRGFRVAMVLVAVWVAANDHASRSVALDEARAQWETMVSVVVATETIEAGERLDGRVEIRELPEAAVARSAQRELASGATARAVIVAGEVVVGERLASLGGDAEVDAVVSLAIFGSAPTVEVGDLVDLWTVDTSGRTGDAAAVLVAESAVVIERSDADLSVGVSDSVVAPLAAAAVRPLVVVRVG